MLPSSDEDRWVLFLRLRGHLVLWTLGFFKVSWSGGVVGGGVLPLLAV